ncbi:MAG: hypothetical protein AB7G20_10175 [Sulfurimonas sp.]|uniref:hypothetical protein n=1 Tax=Sulfurimonas sp. TaxID=2022749 RepID=UPI003D0D8C94
MSYKFKTISIIGHRDLLPEYLDILKKHIVAILQDIKKQNTDFLLRFMSPLAEGSDQLGAEMALQMGCKLIVPLPMEQKEYLENFDEKSKKKFEDLLLQADESFVLKCNKCLSKEDYYLNLGKYLIQNSNILLVLWDGEYSDKIGGTGNIMKNIDELTAASSLLKKIIHLRVPRKNNHFIERRFQIDEINIQHKVCL